MRACFDLSASDSGLIATLTDVVEFLCVNNVAWIREHQAMGEDPPCCVHCAEPPWTAPGGVAYVEHHGAPQGTCREYWGADKMFTWGQGTCADIVAYDVAALRVKGVNANPIIIPQGGGNFHAVLWREDKGQEDPTQEWKAGPVRPMPGTQCGCAPNLGAQADGAHRHPELEAQIAAVLQGVNANVGGCNSGACKR